MQSCRSAILLSQDPMLRASQKSLKDRWNLSYEKQWWSQLDRRRWVKVDFEHCTISKPEPPTRSHFKPIMNYCLSIVEVRSLLSRPIDLHLICLDETWWRVELNGKTGLSVFCSSRWFSCRLSSLIGQGWYHRIISNVSSDVDCRKRECFSIENRDISVSFRMIACYLYFLDVYYSSGIYSTSKTNIHPSHSIECLWRFLANTDGDSQTDSLWKYGETFRIETRFGRTYTQMECLCSSLS